MNVQQSYMRGRSYTLTPRKEDEIISFAQSELNKQLNQRQKLQTIHKCLLQRELKEDENQPWNTIQPISNNSSLRVSYQMPCLLSINRGRVQHNRVGEKNPKQNIHIVKNQILIKRINPSPINEFINQQLTYDLDSSMISQKSFIKSHSTQFVSSKIMLRGEDIGFSGKLSIHSKKKEQKNCSSLNKVISYTISPLRKQKSVNLKEKSVNLKEKTVNLKEKTVNLKEKSVNQKEKCVNQIEKSVNLIEKNVNLKDKSANLKEKSVNQKEKSVNLKNKNVNLKDKSVNLKEKSVNLKNKSVNQKEKSVNLKENSLDKMDTNSISYQKQTLDQLQGLQINSIKLSPPRDQYKKQTLLSKQQKVKQNLDLLNGDEMCNTSKNRSSQTIINLQKINISKQRLKEVQSQYQFTNNSMDNQTQPNFHIQSVFPLKQRYANRTLQSCHSIKNTLSDSFTI